MDPSKIASANLAVPGRMFVRRKCPKDGCRRYIFVSSMAAWRTARDACWPVDNNHRIGEVLALPGVAPPGAWRSVYALSARVESADAFHGARPDAGPGGPDLRAAARRLGRQRHQDRSAIRRRRTDGRAAG